MSAIALFALLSFTAISSAGYAGIVADREIIESFLKCPEIVRAQEELSGPQTSSGPARIVLRSYLCGAVGCQSSVLVAQEFERRGVNPSLTNLLASVHVNARGEVSSVERVVLVPPSKIEGSHDSAGTEER